MQCAPAWRLAAGRIDGNYALHWLACFVDQLLWHPSCREAAALVRADPAAAAALARLATLRLPRLTSTLPEEPGAGELNAITMGSGIVACLLPDMLARCAAAGSPQLPAECLDGAAVCAASLMALLDSEVRGDRPCMSSCWAGVRGVAFCGVKQLAVRLGCFGGGGPVGGSRH